MLEELDDFNRGHADAEKGEPCKENQSAHYYKGYSFGYQCMQILDHKTEKQDELIRKAQ